MALSDLSFKLYMNSGLTVAYGGTSNLTNNKDFSDNPQDTLLYLGSSVSARYLRATSSPGVDQIALTPTDITPTWAASTAYTLGQILRPTTTNGYTYIVTVAGTSSATQPTWPTTTVGVSTVVDGTVTWKLYSHIHAITEVKLATTLLGLDTATAGAALNLGVVITGGVANAISIYMRVTNAVADVSNNTINPSIGININSIVETSS